VGLAPGGRSVYTQPRAQGGSPPARHHRETTPSLRTRWPASGGGAATGGVATTPTEPDTPDPRELEAALKEARAEIARLREERRDADRIKTDFLAMISHELRTPLTAILGYTDLLLRDTQADQSSRQYHHQQAVRQAANRLLALVNDLLDVSRLESGVVELEPEPVAISDVIQEALAQVREQAAAAHITLRTTSPADLPLVLADQPHLIQVLVNLLSNAIKFSPGAGTVDVGARREHGSVVVSVRDTGVGIEPQHLPRIWDRFYQADSSVRRRFGGAGIGLAIVRRLVELHGGEAWAESSGLGQGSVFSFSVPVEAGPAAVPEAPVEAASIEGTVLVVEDEQNNRDMIKMLLETVLPVRVITASDGLQAIEAAAEQPDLILLDLMLPHLDGFEVARRLKSDPRTASIPILALTALVREQDIADALAAGCDGVVIKPFDTDDLARQVARYLRRAHGSSPYEANGSNSTNGERPDEHPPEC
jgi:signal transduction histidine kinase/CheY-like chemotaxis protein